MSVPRRKKFFVGAIIAGSLLMLSIFVPRFVVVTTQQANIFTAETLPERSVAIVFGAGLRRDGGASAVLRDRVFTAAQLYFEGKVDFLLLSGDNPTIYYDEPGAMREYALSLGVPEEALVLDYAGRRTYDTCYRARDVFQVQEAVLVTQAFHQSRALFTCNALGVASIGVPARESQYWPGRLTSWQIREIPAAIAAVWDVYIAKPLPVLGDIEPIELEVQ